jgi:hypothetical protein
MDTKLSVARHLRLLQIVEALQQDHVNTFPVIVVQLSTVLAASVPALGAEVVESCPKESAQRLPTRDLDATQELQNQKHFDKS